MRRVLIALFVLACLVQPALAGDKGKRLILDLWDSAYLQGAKSGYVHTLTEEYQENGETLLKTTVELRLTVKRNQDVIELNMDSGTIENLQGKVTGVFMKQYLGKNKTLEFKGTVLIGKLRVVIDGTKSLDPEPWDPNVVGLFRQQTMLKERNVKPGDEFDFLSYEASINSVVPMAGKVKEYEEVELFGGQYKKKLLWPFEVRPGKINKVQLPTLTMWVGDNRMVQRSQVEVPGLGALTLYRSSKAVATAPGPLNSLTDIGLSQMVLIKMPIANPDTTTSAVYRITVRGDNDPSSTFSSDARQQIKNVKENTFDLVVRADGKQVAEKTPGAEFTQSSYFINSDDALVKKHAKAAVGNEKDAWKKALLIEKWVHEQMKPTNDEALATADHVARTLQGDCTEYAMLTAAMCRAEGIPSRTAVGLVYADIKDKPGFAFHMWTEVFMDRHWVPIDATLGQGKVAATHLKIADQSWHEARNMIPLFPVMRVVGRVSIEVLSVENSPRP